MWIIGEISILCDKNIIQNSENMVFETVPLLSDSGYWRTLAFPVNLLTSDGLVRTPNIIIKAVQCPAALLSLTFDSLHMTAEEGLNPESISIHKFLRKSFKYCFRFHIYCQNCFSLVMKNTTKDINWTKVKIFINKNQFMDYMAFFFKVKTDHIINFSNPVLHFQSS